MRDCPDCPGQIPTKNHNEPTLSPSGFLDQIIVCRAGCGWCGVESVALTEAEIKEFRLVAERPKQLRLL